jgi:hypothetical protein
MQPQGHQAEVYTWEEKETKPQLYLEIPTPPSPLVTARIVSYDVSKEVERVAL